MRFLSREHFELLKGLGIMAVLICHIGGYSGLTYFTPLGGIGVALFLFCSGYGLRCSYTDTGLKHFWKKKIIGVYSTYFLIELVTAFVFARNLKTIVLDLLLIRPAYSYGWYMQYLFGCYLIFWLVFKFIKRENIRIITLCSLSVCSFFVFDGLRGEQAFSFVAGVLTAMLGHNKAPRCKRTMVLSIIALFVSVVLLAVKQHPVVRQQNPYILTALDLLIKSLAAAGLIYLTYAIDFIEKYFGKVFSFFGKISYVLYLIHGYLIIIIRDDLLGNYIINSVVFAVVAIAVAYIVNLVVKSLQKHSIKYLV